MTDFAENLKQAHSKNEQTIWEKMVGTQKITLLPFGCQLCGKEVKKYYPYTGYYGIEQFGTVTVCRHCYHYLSTHNVQFHDFTIKLHAAVMEMVQIITLSTMLAIQNDIARVATLTTLRQIVAEHELLQKHEPND